MMSSHDQRAEALADKITAKAEEAVACLDREMAVMKWPAGFRAIMWEAVALVATSRAAELRRSSTATTSRG